MTASRKATHLLADTDTLNGTAPDLDVAADECEVVSIAPAELTRFQAAMVKVLQWVEGGAAPRPTGDDMRSAIRGLCGTRNGGKSPGCHEWVAARMGFNRNTLTRLITGETPIHATHILSLQALILTDWIRREGYEPLAIFSKDTDTALARSLREKVKGYVPPEEVKPMLSLEEMEDEWENMCLQIVESGLTLSEEEFQTLGSQLSSVSHRIAAKYIREEKGAKGKYYVDHANRVVSDATAGRLNI